MEYTGICDIGKKRDVNQDAILMEAQGDIGIFAVADGMGGHSHGELASQCIVHELRDWWERFAAVEYEYDFMRMLQSLQQRVEFINRTIYKEYNQHAVCGSTMVILFIYKNHYGILYAGDSRAYQCVGRKVKQLSRDDVWENQVGLSDYERKLNWKTHNGKLTNAVGTSAEITYRIFTDEYEAGMIFLLCSDGLYKCCSGRQLNHWMKRGRKEKDLNKVCTALLDIVYKNGAKDNTSIILVR